MKSKSPKAVAPLSLRISPELHQKLEECAEKTKIKKYSLAIVAIEAAVEAIERNGYRIVMPIEFDVKQVAVSRETPENSTGQKVGKKAA